MRVNKFLNGVAELFIEPGMLQREPYDAFRILLVVGLLSIVIFISSAFGLFHLLVTGMSFNMLINILSGSVLLFFLYMIHKNRALGWIAHASVGLIFLYFPSFIYINQAQEFSMVWLFFAPFAIISLVGHKNGIRYLIVFYSVVFFMTYQGIGQWDDGNWTLMSYLRFVVASVLGTALAVVIDMASSGLNSEIANQRLKEKRYITELKRLSTTDALTEVFNRHYFKEVMHQKLAELQNSDLYLTFFILDVDHFKLYNDEFGHQQGDEVLRKVARKIRSYVKRREDLVFRLGGEEFGGLVVSDDPVATEKWLEPLRKEIEELKIPHAKGSTEKYVTVSMGIYSSKVKEAKAIDKLYSIADKALYQAKNLGRNRVCIASKTGLKSL